MESRNELSNAETVVHRDAEGPLSRSFSRPLADSSSTEISIGIINTININTDITNIGDRSQHFIREYSVLSDSPNFSNFAMLIDDSQSFFSASSSLYLNEEAENSRVNNLLLDNPCYDHGIFQSFGVLPFTFENLKDLNKRRADVRAGSISERAKESEACISNITSPTASTPENNPDVSKGSSGEAQYEQPNHPPSKFPLQSTSIEDPSDKKKSSLAPSSPTNLNRLTPSVNGSSFSDLVSTPSLRPGGPRKSSKPSAKRTSFSKRRFLKSKISRVLNKIRSVSLTSEKTLNSKVRTF
ncbi:Sec14 domain containing protein [Cryptosporidium felis]|nr:Sec14 domain containing protein [Cryptosporidium felis]